MILTYLTTKDIIEKAWKKDVQDLHSLAKELESRHPNLYNYRIVYGYLIREDEERARRFKNSLFQHILDILQIDPYEISDRFIEQPLITPTVTN